MEFVLLALLVGCMAYVALPALLDFWHRTKPIDDGPPAEEFKEPLDVPNFGKMSKTQIEEWARENLELDLDRRMTKANMIKEVAGRVK